MYIHTVTYAEPADKKKISKKKTCYWINNNFCDNKKAIPFMSRRKKVKYFVIVLTHRLTNFAKLHDLYEFNLIALWYTT